MRLDITAGDVVADHVAQLVDLAGENVLLARVEEVPLQAMERLVIAGADAAGVERNRDGVDRPAIDARGLAALRLAPPARRGRSALALVGLQAHHAGRALDAVPNRQDRAGDEVHVTRDELRRRVGLGLPQPAAPRPCRSWSTCCRVVDVVRAMMRPPDTGLMMR
jgi:hypothetical protein